MSAIELPLPVRMQRVAIIARPAQLRDALVALAEVGSVEISGPPGSGPTGRVADALRRVQPTTASMTSPARVTREEVELDDLVDAGDLASLRGEIEVGRVRSRAITQNGAVYLVGWTPRVDVEALRERLAQVGAAVVNLPTPRGETPPTMLTAIRPARPFRPLLDTYGVLPYSNIDPTAFAAVAFIAMFGMMFGDVGHGLLLALAGAWLWRTRGRFARFTAAAPLLVSAGMAGVVFGFAYGECFGPTGILEPLWLSPLDEPIRLLTAALVAGSALLAISYLIGTINRWREGGAALALYAQAGLAGALVFVAFGLAVLGAVVGSATPLVAAAVVGGIAMILLFVGARAEAGGGGVGITMGSIEVFDAVVRVGSNVVSFTRLAAFGMTHAALALVVWNGAEALAGGVLGWTLAALLFIVGTAVAIGLEGLVAAVQALRLEYYELFSRIMIKEGRAFTPFRLPVVDGGASPIHKEVA